MHKPLRLITKIQYMEVDWVNEINITHLKHMNLQGKYTFVKSLTWL